MAKNQNDVSSKEIEERIQDYVLSNRRFLLSEIKVLDLYDYMSEDKFSDDPSQSQTPFYIPFISQSLLKNPKHFTSILSSYIFSDGQYFPHMTYKFFTYKNNTKHLNYFVQCCFPSLFNYFSSDEYSFYAYNFIKQYLEVEHLYKKKPIPEDIHLLTSNKLILTYIIHNFQFRQIFFEKFTLEVIKNTNSKNTNMNSEVELFILLIDSFNGSISYLDEYQLGILKHKSKSSGIENLVSLFKQLFIKLIKIWSYTPQFYTNELLGSVPDSPKNFSSKLITFISNYDYKKNRSKTDDKSKIDDRFRDLIEKDIISSPFLQHNRIKDALFAKKDFLILSDYDALLFTWIIMQESDEIPINGTNMKRNYTRKEEFSSKKSALRFFYVEFDIKNPFQKTNQSETRDKTAALHFIKNQIEACEQIKESIILKYSDANYLNDCITYGQDFCEKQLQEIEKENNDKLFTKLNSSLFIFGQLFTYFNRNSMSVSIKKNDLNVDIDKLVHIKYALSRSFLSKNDSPYFSGFRFLTMMEFSSENYECILTNFKVVFSYDFNDILKSILLLKIIQEKISEIESKNSQKDSDKWELDINGCHLPQYRFFQNKKFHNLWERFDIQNSWARFDILKKFTAYGQILIDFLNGTSFKKEKEEEELELTGFS